MVEMVPSSNSSKDLQKATKKPSTSSSPFKQNTQSIKKPSQTYPTSTSFDIYDLLLWIVMIAHVILIPYYRGEERFYAESTFDLLFPPSNSNDWYHQSYGPVPKTILGSMLISGTVYPLFWILQKLQSANWFGILDNDSVCLPMLMLYLVRIALGTWFIAASSSFRRALKKQPELFGARVSKFVALLSLFQFPLLFNSSRTLSSTFNMIFVLFGLSSWLRRKYINASIYMIISFGIYRFDSLSFWIGILLSELYILRYSQVKRLVIYFILLGITIIGSSIAIDSYWYNRLLWPEWESFVFNIWQGKSSLLGILPYYWYLTTAIPKLLAFALPWVFLSLFTHPKLSAKLLLPVIFCVSILSLIPHKDYDFIFPIIPILNTIAALSMNSLTQNQWRIFRFTFKALLLITFLSIICTGLFSMISSSWNYPGGKALNHLNQIESSKSLNISMEKQIAMSGACPYQKCHKNWSYGYHDKFESLPSETTHLLTEKPELYSSKFTIIDQVLGFEKILIPSSITELVDNLYENLLHKRDFNKAWNVLKIDINNLPSLSSIKDSLKNSIVLVPKVYIMKRKNI